MCCPLRRQWPLFYSGYKMLVSNVMPRLFSLAISTVATILKQFRSLAYSLKSSRKFSRESESNNTYDTQFHTETPPTMQRPLPLHRDPSHYSAHFH